MQGRNEEKGLPVFCASPRPQSSAHDLEFHSTQLETLIQTELLSHLSTAVPRSSLTCAQGKESTFSGVLIATL